MKHRRYTIKTACPQCGCSSVTHLSAEEIKEKFGNVANVEMECQECMLKYTSDMETVCPEWAKDCKLSD